MAKSTPLKPPKSAGIKKTAEQEKFENDLKALAAKAKGQTFSRWALSQVSILFQSAILLSLAATFANVSLLNLSPVFGGIPSSIYHDKIVITALFLGWSLNLYFKRILPVKPVLLVPIFAAYTPVVQFYIFQHSSLLGGRLGPLITESLTLFPVLFISIAWVGTLLDDLELRNGGNRLAWLSDALPGITSFLFFKRVEYVSSNVISETIGSTIVHTRLGLEAFVSALFALFAPSKLLLLAVPGVLHTALLNTHVNVPYQTAALNTTLNADGWNLIERKESLTGYISVVESKERGFRVMRCDHSLLGGEWLLSITKSDQTEPIYGIFVMLEAIRLIEVPNPVEDKDAKALVIGLGIGTTPAALNAHGIDTTIVEIDPVVHEFAVKYFGFPSRINAKLTDAVAYTNELVLQGVEKYDYIVHDVFTGGAEPIALFTIEFIGNLKSLLKPNGIVAINFAGDILLPSARIVVHTILSTFTSINCRIYRESEQTEAETPASNANLDFTNMVIYCINAPPPASSSSPTSVEDDLSTEETSSSDAVPKEVITFRRPYVEDLLNSQARRMWIMPRHEIKREAFGTLEELKEVGGLLEAKDAEERFKKWHERSALGHWVVMRDVIPPDVWIRW